MGGLGLLVAQWMVERKAKHLVLVGRSEVNAAARSQIKKLEQAGAQVVVIRADVSVEGEVAQLFKDIERSLPPLRGIIHSAGTLDDGVLVQQTWERFARVLAINLDR